MSVTNTSLQAVSKKDTLDTIDTFDPSCLRIRRDVNDPFFLKGYQLAWRNEEGMMAVPYVPIDQDREFKSKAGTTRRFPQYPCGVVGCPQVFSSLSDCDAHYEECHIFQCGTCFAIMPSDRLLDLHLQEAHDSFFAVATQRRLAKFSCLVCEAQFETSLERNAHLMHTHQYPKWFRFVPRSIVSKVELEEMKKKHKWIINHSKSNKPDALMNEEPDTEKLRRRERQKQKRASIPCKFYSSDSGCWRGSKCMFLHTTTASSLVSAANVDDLTNQLATLLVPDKISFGRKRRLN